jgi:hypothetical protein
MLLLRYLIMENIPRKLVNPRFERPIFAVAFPVADQPEKDRLHQVVAQFPVVGKPEEEVVEPHLVPLEKQGGTVEVACFYFAHGLFV